jgi:hypothetical protein
VVHGANKVFDEWMHNAPLFTSEMNKQMQDLELIRSWAGSNSDLINNLRQSSKITGIQPFRRRIVKEE